jgi:hypothetical protein
VNAEGASWPCEEITEIAPLPGNDMDALARG